MPKFAHVSEIFAAMPQRFRAERARRASALVQFELSGNGAGRYWVQVQDGVCRTGEGAAPRAADATVTASADDWLRISNGDLNPVVAAFTGRLKIDGAMPLVLDVAGGFRD